MVLRTATKDENDPGPRTSIMVAARANVAPRQACDHVGQPERMRLASVLKRQFRRTVPAAGPRRCATTPGATQGLQESPPILVCGAAFRLPIVGKISPASHPGFCIHSLLRDSCCCLVPFAFSSPNDFVRSCQHVRWNRQAKCLRGLQIDHELELRRLLHRQVGRLGTFKNSVDVVCGAPEILRFVG